MKKQLLTAILAITPVFAAAKPTDAELSVHLKMVKKDIELFRLEVMEQSANLYRKLGKEDYFFLLNMILDIDQQLGHALKNKIFDDLDITVNLLCNEMKTIMDIDDIITERFEEFVATNPLCITKNSAKEAMLIQSIAMKHYEQYCRNNPHGNLTINCLTKLDEQNTLIPFLLYSGIEWMYELSKRIDVKIAELEKQV